MKKVHTSLRQALTLGAPIVLLGLIVLFSSTSVSALLNSTPSPCIDELRVVPQSGSALAPTFVPAGATADLALATAQTPDLALAATPCATQEASAPGTTEPTRTSFWVLPTVGPGTRIPLVKEVTSTPTLSQPPKASKTPQEPALPEMNAASSSTWTLTYDFTNQAYSPPWMAYQQSGQDAMPGRWANPYWTTVISIGMAAAFTAWSPSRLPSRRRRA